ncbi:MAG TPA: hypothetical protein VLA56_14305 [Pseudomonadales bacterium]|nr:hypothetical protein [Pseudomonadales bacterium]
MNLKKFVKFLHTLGSIGFTGAIASQMVLLALTPATTQLAEYVQMRQAIAAIGTWVLFPSLGLVLTSGLLAIGINRAFHDVGWVWAKLALGISVFEGTLIAVHGPAQRIAERAAAALAGEIDPAVLDKPLHDEWGAMSVIMGVALVNIVLGVWRPRFIRRRIGDPTRAPAADA